VAWLDAVNHNVEGCNMQRLGETLYVALQLAKNVHHPKMLHAVITLKQFSSILFCDLHPSQYLGWLLAAT
jgi:hypothetical protein